MSLVPRIGSRKSRRPRSLFDPSEGDPRLGPLPSPDDDAPADDPSAMSPYAGLSAHRREQAIIAASETLDEIAAIQGQTRDRTGKIRRAKFVASVLALRWEGFSPKETAEVLGCSWQAVTRALLQVRKDAGLDDQIKRLNDIAVPLAMDNAVRGVMEGDKEYTLRVLDGTGVFRSHATIKGEIKQRIEQLSVVLMVPAHLEGKELPMPKPGSVVGAPTIAAGLPPAQALEGVSVQPLPREGSVVGASAVVGVGERELKD